MASAGGANAWVLSMQSRQGGAIACRPSSTCSLLLQRAPSGLSQAALRSARFIGILSFPRSRMSPNVIAIHAQDPDFYKIPYVEGVPVGKRLKLWNLPPNCKHSELLEWFAGVDVKVDSLEFTDDPALNAQGIGGCVELATKQDACIAIVRLDGYKFRGHYIRLDFAEKRPHSRDYGSRRNRPNRSSSSGSRGNFATPSRSTVTDMVPSYDGTTSASARAQSTARYEAADSSTVHAPSGYSSSAQSTAQLNLSDRAANFSTVQASSDYGRSTESSDFPLNGADNSRDGVQTNPGYGNVQSPSGYGSSYGAAEFPPGPGGAPSSSISGGSLPVPSTPPPWNIQSPPKYGISPEHGNMVRKTTEDHTLPSVAGYGSPQSSPSYGNTPVSGSPLQQRNDSTIGSPQRPPSQSDTELNGQSAAVPSSSSYNNRSGAPLYRNRNMQPLYSDGTVTGKSFKGGSGWAAHNNLQGTANYGVDKLARSSSDPQAPAPTSANSSQPSSSSSILNNQSGTASGKYGSSRTPLASSIGTNTNQSGSGYGSIKDTAYENSVLPSCDNSNRPSGQSSSSHHSIDSQSAVSSYGSMGTQSNTTSTQSSFGSSQIPSVFSSMKSSPGSVSKPAQPSYGEAQPSARSSPTQAVSSSYDGMKKNPFETVSNNSMHRPVAQGLPSRSPNSSYAPVDTYEDPFENYGVPNAAVLEPWLHDMCFRSGPMFGSPQPSSLNRLFVGNLAVSIDDATLHELFSKFGTVLEARVLRDQESGRSRGFALVSMSNADDMKAASKALDGWRVESRALRVDAVTFKH